MEELAENLQKLNEDDLLSVVQMIHDGKSTDSYTKNDVDGRRTPSLFADLSATFPSFGQSFPMTPAVSTYNTPTTHRSTTVSPHVGPDGRMLPMNSNGILYGFDSRIRANVNPLAGEFHVDLYTLPDDLINNLWTFTEGKV